MKNLLYQLDTDNHPSVFDSVVGYDGGADHVIGYANVNPDNVSGLVEGAIFTRSPKEKKHTALFIGGSNMDAGEELFTAAQKTFFANFRVSIMLDSNGSNTTAAAAVAKIQSSVKLAGKRAVILAGTGPVGQRAAVMLVKEGVDVAITSRKLENAERICAALKTKFDIDVEARAGGDLAERADAITDANIVIATGAGGIELLSEEHWKDNKNIEVIADANATPPLGIAGTDMLDKGVERHGKIIWGAIGFGALKLSLHRKCIAQLFESNDLVLDAEQIFALAKEMV